MRERPGISAFVLENGVVHHTYSAYARGLDALWGIVRHGREKLHFLNLAPLQEIYDRWIAKFEKPSLKNLAI